MQLVDALNFAWASSGRFLFRDKYGHRFEDACPVGGIAVRVGQTGRPTPHPTFGENGYVFGSKAHRNAAASFSAMERA